MGRWTDLVIIGTAPEQALDGQSSHIARIKSAFSKCFDESNAIVEIIILDQIKVSTFLGTDRGHVIRQVILATRKGGRISIPGVYGGMADKFPIGALMEKGLQIKSGQTHVQKYMPQLLEMVLDGKIDTTFLISHHLDLEDAALGYKNFKEKQNEYTKVVLRPGLGTRVAVH